MSEGKIQPRPYLEAMLNDLANINQRLSVRNDNVHVQNRVLKETIDKFNGNHPKEPTDIKDIKGGPQNDSINKDEVIRYNLQQEIDYHLKQIYEKLFDAEELSAITNKLNEELKTII